MLKEFVLEDGRYIIKSNPKCNDAGKWCIGIRVFDHAGGLLRVSEEGPAQGTEDCAYETENDAHEAGFTLAAEMINAGDVRF